LDVVFKNGGSYDPITKTCSGTSCHTGAPVPQWGGSVNSAVTCLSCHGATAPDIDSFVFIRSGTQAKIDTDEWYNTGHGRPSSKGPYPSSGNPAANFPGNPCWYCHDNTVLHNYTSVNPFRLRHHQQFINRFDKECVYCHMVGTDTECLSCHNSVESLAPQLESEEVMTMHTNSVKTSGCRDVSCHDSDASLHQSGAGFWRQDQKDDVRNQYIMMGVCLKCHDDDTGGKCTSCHTAPADNPLKYSIGFKPFSTARFVKPQKARASSVHFGYKHNREYLANGVWKGGKFCWDCHDPHGDSNIYMIQSQVATSTEGKFGIPKTRATVVFTKKQSGLDYARISEPYDGICNVCHSAQNEALSKHYGNDYGDGHSASRPCTGCHEHRFSDSHADNQPCNICHLNKPVPRHSGFGQPRDCTKCHAGTINMRMDVMGQMNANSHHVQGGAVTNKHCYACHWEATPEGLIDNRYHEGYNYKSYTSVKNAKVDLVVWKPGTRPAYYNQTTAVQFFANRIGTAQERTEVAKITSTCISCHSDQNNDSQPFGDCKTPRQYAWDGQSVAARYSQTGTTAWGKYNSTTYPNANQKDKLTKALSAHGNATANQGGFSTTNGIDSNIPNSRGGGQNVQCFDCHSSHGSKVVGITSSYITFNGSHNGGNLKETQAGKGGYAMSYMASANTSSGAVNPYNAGAGQCFDCHLTQNSGVTPWGYQSTFGATEPIKGYFDSAMFGPTNSGAMEHYQFKQSRPAIGGHLKATIFLNRTTSAQNRINGLCTPCHDPHGVTPALGSKQGYAVPLLKGTWMTSPYREDLPQVDGGSPPGGNPWAPTQPTIYTDTNTFNDQRINEDETSFAGLCLGCHTKNNLTDGSNHTWKSRDRVHESVKGWKSANGTIQHSYTCSKCHTPHASGLKRLMVTNCLNYNHRGRIPSGGGPGANGDGVYADWGPGNPGGASGSFPKGFLQSGVNCHPGAAWPDNSWNAVTPW
jgi:predicted CxxxxCH...CXXCH cytochrome family protein